jgi:hypothetical protein
MIKKIFSVFFSLAVLLPSLPLQAAFQEAVVGPRVQTIVNPAAAIERPSTLSLGNLAVDPIRSVQTPQITPQAAIGGLLPAAELQPAAPTPSAPNEIADPAIQQTAQLTAPGQVATKDAPEVSGSLAAATTLGRGAVSSEKVFDGGPSVFAFGVIRPRESPALALPKGVALTKKTQPLAEQDGPVSISKFHLNIADGVELNANPADTVSVEKALMALVDANPGAYGASSSAEMAPVHVELLPGIGNQADSIIAVFRQVKQGRDKDGTPYFLAVENANLRFHIKVVNGKAVLLAEEGGFVRGIDPKVMTVNYSDDELRQIAAGVVQSAPSASADPAGQDPKIQFVDRRITYIDKAWRAANVYQGSDLNGNPVTILVDVSTGKPYAVNPDDMRFGGFSGRGREPRMEEEPQPITPETPHAPITALAGVGEDAQPLSGAAQARGMTLTADGQDHGPTGPMALINAYVYDDSGKVVATTDDKGSFTIPAGVNGGQPMRVTVKLAGIFSQVFDDDSKDAALAATLTVTPGQPVTLTLNASGDDEQLDASVNAYVYPNLMINWIKSMLGLGNDARFFAPLRNGTHSNGTAMVANAFYDPVTDAFYLMKSGSIKIPAQSQTAKAGTASFFATASVTQVGRKGRSRTVTLTAENTAVPSIELHEYGHRQFQVASQLRLSAEQAASDAYRFVKWLIDPIIGSDANEAGADTFSMFIRNCAVIGNLFFTRADPPSALPTPNIIRTGENQTPYNPSQTDPHALGEPQMGTAWMTRQDLIKEMGPEDGAVYAARLFLRTWLYVQPGTAVTALMHALIADMAKDGSIPHAEMIQGHAQNEHNMTLPPPSGGPAS